MIHKRRITKTLAIQNADVLFTHKTLVKIMNTDITIENWPDGQPLSIKVNGVDWIPQNLESQEKPKPPKSDIVHFSAAAFFGMLRDSMFDGSLTQGQVDGINLIGAECKRQRLTPLYKQTAYVLATVYHETAKTMAPISEYGGQNTRYAPWYGRGHVQLTWEDNYKRQQKKHGDLGNIYKVHDDYNRALIPEVSATICVCGMRDGDFTGKRLDDYINETNYDYVNARRIVNGTDKAEMIADYANRFLEAFKVAVS